MLFCKYKIRVSLLRVILPFMALLPFFCSTAAYGQYVINGGTSAATGWMQVKGETYNVIYPQGADSLAKRYLWLLEQNKQAVMLGLSEIKPAKIPVVLYNGTANSNGMVVWAPKRMELYTLPMRSSYPIRWEEQLAVHEARHVGQMTHFTKGAFGVLEYLLGQQSPSIGVGLYASRWLFEGDAVVAETELTNSGRGRNAKFMEYYRTAFLEGDLRGWNKWKLGSYKHFTPDVYKMGYLVNSTIRYRTGNYDYAGELLDAFVKRPYNPFVTEWGFKKVAGNGRKEFFKDGQDMMTSIWREELENRGHLTEPQDVLQHRGRGYQEYSSPVVVGRDSVLYIKYSYNNPVQLVFVSGGKEEVIRSFSSSVQRIVHSGDNIFFTENVSSSRWSNEVYGRLFRYNWKTGLTANGAPERLSGKTYYLFPKISKGGDTLMVEEFYPQGGASLALLDPQTGELKERIDAPYNGELVESAFLGDDIYSLAITDRGLGLFEKGKGKEWRTVIGEQAASIVSLGSGKVPGSLLGLTGNGNVEVLYFESDIDGVRNIYVLEPKRGILKRLTNSRYGAGEPFIADGELYYSSLELGGKFPVKISLDDIEDCGSIYDPVLENGKLASAYRYRVADELSAQAKKALGEKGLLASDEEIARVNGTSVVKHTVSQEEFASGVQAKRYGKFGNLFRFHSWAPVYYNVDRIMNFDFDKLHQAASLGATAYSQNTLGTAVTMLGYSYHKGLHAGHLKFSYSGWYPVFQISADVNADERYNVRIVKDSVGFKQVIEEAPGILVGLEGLAYVPLKFNSHGWQRGIVPQVAVQYDNNGYYDNSSRKYLCGTTIVPAIQLYAMRDMQHSGIFPKWGIGVTANMKFVVNGGENFGNASSLYLYGYLPGFAPNHGIKLSSGFQYQNVEGKNYYLGNLVKMPRGYTKSFYGRSYILGTADYAFPIYLGDISVWELAYLKRLQVIPFADCAVIKGYSGEGSSAKSNLRLSSCGTSLLVDMAPFIWGIECSVGVMYSYNSSNLDVPGTGNDFQLLFSISL